jgi:RNA polymerase sigma factor (sigma-70 family)
MAGAVSFGDIQSALDAAIRTAAARWHLRGVDADDFAQDVRVAVLLHDHAALRRFRGDGATTYFYRIADRVAIDRVRRQHGRSRTFGDFDTSAARRRGEVPPRQGFQPHVQPEVETAALQEQVVRGLQRALAVLNDNEREILARRFGRDESANAIAHATGGSRSAAARRLAALLTELRDLLAQVGVSRDDVAQALALSRIDAALLDDVARPDSTRPDP